MTNNSLRTRLIVSFIALAIGPLLLAGIIIVWQSFSVQREQALALQYAIARRASVQIESFLRDIESELELVARIDELLGLQREQQQQLLTRLLTHQHNPSGYVFGKLALLDAAGYEQARASRLADDLLPRPLPPAAATDIMQPFTTGQAYFSPVWFAGDTNEPLITLALPIEELQTGFVTSVLLAEIRLKMMWDVVADIDVGTSGSAYIVNAAGRLIAHPNPSEVLRGLHFAPPGRDGIQQGLAGNPVVLTSQMLTLGKQTLYLITESPISEALAPTRQTIALIGGLMLVVLLTAIQLGIFLIRQLVQPIEALAVTARAIEAGDLSQRAAIQRADEIGALAEAFNAMANRLQHNIYALETHTDELEQTTDALREIGQALNESLQKEKELHEMKSRFVSVVSHEFRTPLTSIQSSTEILEQYREKLPPEKKEQHLRRIHMNVEAMTRLLNDVIFIGHIDSRRRALKPTHIDLKHLCEELIEEMQPAYPNACAIQHVAHAECEVEMDEQILRHILTNLLSNAMKYSPAGSAVELEIGCEAGTITMTIRDHGIGIPEADQETLFEAFHRADNVGSISGSGLGLSIVKRCVDLYHGTLQFTSREGLGTTFWVTLPTDLPGEQEDTHAKDISY